MSHAGFMKVLLGSVGFDQVPCRGPFLGVVFDNRVWQSRISGLLNFGSCVSGLESEGCSQSAAEGSAGLAGDLWL